MGRRHKAPHRRPCLARATRTRLSTSRILAASIVIVPSACSKDNPLAAATPASNSTSRLLGTYDSKPLCSATGMPASISRTAVSKLRFYASPFARRVGNAVVGVVDHGAVAELDVEGLPAEQMSRAGHDVGRGDAARLRSLNTRVANVDRIHGANVGLDRIAAVSAFDAADVAVGVDQAGHDDFAGHLVTLGVYGDARRRGGSDGRDAASVDDQNAAVDVAAFDRDHLRTDESLWSILSRKANSEERESDPQQLQHAMDSSSPHRLGRRGGVASHVVVGVDVVFALLGGDYLPSTSVARRLGTGATGVRFVP